MQTTGSKKTDITKQEDIGREELSEKSNNMMTPTEVVRGFKAQVLAGNDYLHPFPEGVSAEQRAAYSAMLRERAMGRVGDGRA